MDWPKQSLLSQLVLNKGRKWFSLWTEVNKIHQEGDCQKWNVEWKKKWKLVAKEWLHNIFNMLKGTKNQM